jgi:hypothetical protein
MKSSGTFKVDDNIVRSSDSEICLFKNDLVVQSESDISDGFTFAEAKSFFNGYFNGTRTDIGTQTVTFNKNPYTFSRGSQNIRSRLTGLTIKDNSNNIVNVSNLRIPLKIKVTNKPEEMTHRQVNLSFPGQLKIDKINISSPDYGVLLKFGFLDIASRINLSLYISYGDQPPSKTCHHHHLKLNTNGIHKEHNVIQMVHTQVPVTSTNSTLSTTEPTWLWKNTLEPNKSNTSAIPPQVSRMKCEAGKTNSPAVKVLDQSSIYLYNLQNLTTNTHLYIAYSYEGPLPPSRKLFNMFTFDVVKKPLPFTFSISSFMPSCVFWNETSSQFEGIIYLSILNDGIQVLII